MSDSHSPTRASAPFAPRALVPVTVGRTAVNLYPVIDQGMPPHERAHAFHINVTALSSQSIDLRAQLDALGHQLNLSATVDGVIQDWLRHFYDRWSDFSSLSILSFHNTKGTQAIDTTDAVDPAILLPVVDGAVTDCRKNVKFVRVQLSVSFLDLVTVANPGPTTLRTEYYIELPQTSKPMTNGAGAAYNLTTFHGTADLRTLTEEQVRAEILDFTLQDGPVELQPASFGVTSARTDSLALRAEIESKILRLAYKTVCNTLFIELCPGYSNQPHAALDHIRQVHSDRDGNPVVSSVQSFYQQLMSASRPFSSQRDYPVSGCARFQDGLDPRLITGFRHLFPQHSTVQSLNAAHQRKTLQEMLQAAQQAEDDFLTVTRVAREAAGLSQAFSATTTGGAGNQATAGAYPSQAETTLNRYSVGGGYSTDGSTPSGGKSKRAYSCFGCGGPHPWSEFRNGKHLVICVNANNPGVRDNAQRNIDRMKANRQKRHKANTKRKNLGTANLVDFDEAGQKRIREQVLNAMGSRDVISDHTSVASSVTTPSTVATPAGRGRGHPRIFVVDVQVLAAGPGLKPMMPVSIQSNLPHIVMQFGLDPNCPNCPSIRCAVDSCAALTTGNFHFFASLVKQFPHIVAKIFAPQDYAPIILSGIVQSNQEAVTTNLEVGFQLHLPYKTKEGDDSSLMIATGPNVSVNTIIGLPFMQGTGMILDLVDNLAECKHLDCPPFPIEFRRTSNHVPVSDDQNAAINLAGPSRDVIQEIVNLERYYDAKVLALRSGIPNQNPGVHFGSKSGTRTVHQISDQTSFATNPASGFNRRWVPPSSGVCEDSSDYHHNVLGEDGFL